MEEVGERCGAVKGEGRRAGSVGVETRGGIRESTGG